MLAELIVRETGQFPISIGTSLALEGYLGIHPKQPARPAGYKAMNSLWINIRTLVRNLYQAVKTEDQTRMKFIDAVSVLLSDIQAIPQILKDANTGVVPTLYLEDSNEFRWVFPKATLKHAKTEKQLHYKTYEEFVLAMLLTHLLEEKIPYVVVKKRPTLQHVQAMILTHEPHHLLWKDQFDRLMLLESHTGKLKLYNVWFTKLNGVTDESPMPFNRYTLQVFGDSYVFDAQERSIKDEMRQMAKSRKWTGLTPQTKMSADISTYGSQALKRNYANLNP